jgi:hypothetical protein
MKAIEATWEPYEKHGRLTTQSDLPDSVFAFPKQRKEPMTDAGHVRNAVARFDQVIDVSDEDRTLVFANIEKAAKYYKVNLSGPIGANWVFIRSETGKKPPPKLLRRRCVSECNGRHILKSDLCRVFAMPVTLAVVTATMIQALLGMFDLRKIVRCLNRRAG